MSFTIRYNPDINAVETNFRGIVTENEIQAQVQANHEIAANNATSLAIVNVTHATLQLSITFIYGLPELCETLGARRPVRMAIVNRNEQNDNLIEFYRLVSQNRGWNVEIFSNQEQAQVWLLA
ncbi:MAG: hypothetical protein AAF579_24040 [Cyanobacteria bacterium P01_C01_bin.118]